ncbi:MAG: glycosyltransferase family 4 protein [Bacteroidota bacterium]
MKWTVLAPYFTQEYIDNNGWLVRYIPKGKYDFELIPRPQPITKWHERKVKYTTSSQWFRHWEHGALALNNDSDGIITSYPQLPTVIGLQKLLKRSKKPLIAWTFNVGNYEVGSIRQWLSGVGLNQVDRFVVHSYREIDIYSKCFNLPKDRFCFVPYAAPDIEIQYEENNESPFIAALGSAHRDFDCFFEVVKELDIPTIVASSKVALADFSIPNQVKTPFGITRKDCWKLAQEGRISVIPLKVKENVTAAGHVTVIEAMLMARAVIVSDAYGMSDYVKHGETGWLVKPGCKKSLKEAIHTLWNDQDLRNRLGQNARAYARERFSHENAALSLEKILDEVSGRTSTLAEAYVKPPEVLDACQ